MIARNRVFSGFFKHVWHGPKMAPVLLLPTVPPPFHLHSPPSPRTNKASDSNWNLLSGLTPDEANIFRPSPPPVTHICRRRERERERERESAILRTESAVKSYHPDFSLISEARVNGKRCLACLIWEVTERPFAVAVWWCVVLCTRSFSNSVPI